ncbi:MAG: hypothetical protein EBT79_07560 [Actinobacteria bacterium]|nr:hypothetical protein [Actinomycetota bacterium]NBR67116.1 hypothetical protein [Actinomycetota bacterium]
MSTPSYTITNDNVTVIIGGRVITVRRGAVNFDAARNAVLNEQWDGIEQVLVPGHAVQRWLGNGFAFTDGVITYGEDKVDARLSERLVRMAEAGDDPTAWMKFWRRLQNNPSMRSVEQLYGFLENKGIPVDAEGYILAYKSIRPDWKDHHSGKCDNSVGNVLQMPRNKISDDPNQACHYGYHVGALEYASTFGGSGDGIRIVICRVDPADVVCVPYDHSMQKVRVCKYEVVAEHKDRTHLSDTFEDIRPEGVIPEKDADLDPEEDAEVPLDGRSLADLRAYAKSIGVKRINNILGGKAGLIKAIVAARGY